MNTFNLGKAKNQITTNRKINYLIEKEILF